MQGTTEARRRRRGSSTADGTSSSAYPDLTTTANTKPSVPAKGHWILSIAFLLINAVGFLLFARGFLLTRMVLSDHSLPSILPIANDNAAAAAIEWYPAKFNRTIILVIDAMRVDFATWSDDLHSMFQQNNNSGGSRLRPYHNRLPIINTLNRKHPEQTMLYRFRADPPTTTLQRLKGLTTGQLPTFIDAGSNFAGSAIDEDNWLQALRSKNITGKGKNLVFLGDDTWISLFPKELSDTREQELNQTQPTSNGWARVRPFPSLNVWDLDTVDDGVLSRLPLFLLPPESPKEPAHVRDRRAKWRQLVRQPDMLVHPDFGTQNASTMFSDIVGPEQLHQDWDFIIAHGLGVDHCGHRFGPDHSAISHKLTQINQAIELIVDSIDQSTQSTALYVFGDHGMDPKGDHGGDSPREVDAALWVYSNTKWNTKEGSERSSRVLHRAASIIKSRPLGALLDDDLKDSWWLNTHIADDYWNQDTKKRLLEPQSLRSIPQIDLVSSLAMSAGLPIPFNNLGTVIPEMFASDGNNSGSGKDEWGLLRALRLNAAQVKRYIDTYVNNSRSHGFPNEALDAWQRFYQQVEETYQELQSKKSANADSGMVRDMEERAAAGYYAYLRMVLGALRQMWAQFDLVLIIAGLVIVALAIVSLACIYWCISWQQHTLEDIVAMSWKRCLGGGVIGAVAMRALGVVLVSNDTSHISSLESTLSGVVIGMTLAFCLGNLSIGLLPLKQLYGYSTVLNAVSCLVTAMHCLAFSSNSFTFNEDNIVLHLLQTLTLATVAAAIYSFKPSSTQKQKDAAIRALVCGLVIMLLNRVSSFSTVCREEQLPGCIPTFYGSPSASISSVQLAAANVVMVWLVPFVIQRLLMRSHSDRAIITKLWVGVGMRVSMGMSSLYWVLYSIDGQHLSSALSSGGIASNPTTSVDDWSELRMVLARMAIGIALGGGLAAWIASPFCLDVEITDAKEQQQQQQQQQKLKSEVQPPTSGKTALVLGYGNAFGAAYLMFASVVFCVLYLTQQPMGGIMLSMLFIKLMLSAELFDSLRDALEVSRSSVTLLPAQTTMMALLSYLGYFATGHQFTLVSIQWSTAFVGVKEMQLVICGVIVALNTMGSFVLTSICVPLVGLWNESLGSQVLRLAPSNYIAGVTSSAVAYAIYHCLISISSAALAAWFRRHLMVWKIFAPRFMFAVPVCLASAGVLLVVAVGIATIRILRLGLEVGNVQSIVASRLQGYRR